METNKHRLMNQSGCLTRETVLAWLENRLSPSEKMVVEEHLRDCILCREALEGFSDSDASRVRTAFADINHAMQQRLLQQEKKSLSRTMKLSLAAAVLLVLVGIFSIFRFKPVEAPMQVAQEMQPHEFKAKTPAPATEEKMMAQERPAVKPQPVSTPAKKEKSVTISDDVANSMATTMGQAAPQPEAMAEMEEKKEEPAKAAEDNESLAYNAPPAAAKKSEAPVMARSARYAEKSVAVEYSDKSETTYYAVEESPKFQNGDVRLFKTYVEGKLKDSPEANLLGKGKVTVTFTVDKNGKLKDAFVAKGIDAKTDALIADIVRNSPTWSPGRQKGKAVNVSLVVEVEVR